MSKDHGIFLQHILESIEAIEEYIKDLPGDVFLTSQEKHCIINSSLTMEFS